MKLLNIFLLLLLQLAASAQFVTITGKVLSENGQPVSEVAITLSGSLRTEISDINGNFLITCEKQPFLKLKFTHLAYSSLVKEFRVPAKDTITLNIFLKEKPGALDTISVVATHKPETLVGKPNYSIYDFDFYEDKLILLTSAKNLNKAELKYSDYSGNIICSMPLPKSAGAAKSFFHDYEGYTDLLCTDTIFRIDMLNTEFMLSPISQKDFSKYIEPVSDTANDNFYLSDKWDKFPLFNYYYLRKNDSAGKLLTTVTNTDLMKIYNMEYYYLPSGAQLHARRLAAEYKTDKRIVAALMSGFTKSMYYEPLYAPLFVLNDTVCVFNHYTDHIYHFNKQNKLIDSVEISYHHPKNWRDWKNRLYVDDLENKVYAFFSRNGHHYLKQINFQNGKEVLTYKLKHHSAEKIKVKDGYVYYVYRPFESTQEKFLYREKIE